MSNLNTEPPPLSDALGDDETPFDMESVAVVPSPPGVFESESVEEKPDKRPWWKPRDTRGSGDRSGDQPSAVGSGRRSPREKRDKPTPPKPREGTLVKPLTDLYTSIGMALMPFDPVCAEAVITNAPECAKALEKLARENEAVRRVITRMLETSAWGGVMIAHLPLLTVVMTHHGPKDVRERTMPLTAFLSPNSAQQMMPEANSDE